MTTHQADDLLDEAQRLLGAQVNTVALLVGRAIVAELRDVRRDLAEIHEQQGVLLRHVRTLDEQVTR